jgi:hypothetical protein
MTDYPDWQTPQAHADAIAITGVPLLANPTAEYALTNVNVPAGTTGQALLNIGGTTATDLSASLSYEVRMRATANAASLVPFLNVRFEWWADQALTLLLYRDEWKVTCGDTAAGPTLYGSGPVRGGFLRILIDNWDGANDILIDDFEIYMSSRPCPFKQPDLRTANDNAHNPTYQVPSEGTSFDGLIGQVHNRLLNTGATQSFIFGLYNGAIDLQLSVTGTAPNVSFTPQYYSKDAGSLLQIAPAVTLTGANLTGFTRVVMPRWPLILTVTELSGANPARLFMTAVAEVQQ